MLFSSTIQEKEITDSSKPNTGDQNNNNVAKKPYRPPVKKRKYLFLENISSTKNISAPPPPPPKEVEVHTLSVLEGHDNYVDIAGWSPTQDSVITASTDK